MYPHRIRLRGPWHWTQGRAAGTLTLPGVLDGVSGPVAFRRRFGYPGTIDAHERVWLLLDGGRVTLNGETLGEGAAFDITGRLRPRNELVVEVDGGTPGEVAMEVRAMAFLADVAWRGGQVTGRVVGEAAGPLDLYVIIGRQTAAQGVVRATGEGTAFALDVPPPGERGRGDGGEEGPPPVRVELVNGAVIWYSIPLAGP